RFATNRLAIIPQMAGETYETMTAKGPQDLPYNVRKAGAAVIAARLSPVGESQVIEGVEKGGVSSLAAGAMARAGLNPRYRGAPAPTTSRYSRYSGAPPPKSPWESMGEMPTGPSAPPPRRPSRS